MGLRCLIGHEYGDAQTERDRRQRGSEVVVTVREFRECTRCGHRRVISENKEVTTDAGAEAAADTGTEPPVEASWSPSEDERADDAVGSVTASATGPVGGDHEEPMTAEEDDGVILEDERDEVPRGHGEWPEAEVGQDDSDPADDHGPWPDEADDDPVGSGESPSESSAAAPADGETGATDTTSEPADKTATARADPEGSAEVLDDAADEPAAEADASAPEASATPSPQPTPRPDPTDVELVCPDCGETWPSINVSLRPGDICPECREGYLDEQVVQ